MGRVSAPCKVGRVRLSRKDSVRTNGNPAAPVLLVQSFPVSRKQYGDRVRTQQQVRGQQAAQAIQSRIGDGRINQVDGLEQLVQGDVRVDAAQSCQSRY